ncbi:MAG TPA: YHS domain-containing protein [Nitrospiria bacterium]
MAQDPVCKMEVREDQAAAKTDFRGTTYYFCALGCKERFEQNPEQYLEKQ